MGGGGGGGFDVKTGLRAAMVITLVIAFAFYLLEFIHGKLNILL